MDAILHVDMDEFIAAVEVLRRPELRDQPVVVGGDGDPTKRGVVSTANYVARTFGIGSGMPLRTAFKKNPDAVFLPVDRDAYDEASKRVMDVLRSFPAVVEVWGWDEAFMAIEADDPEAFARDVQDGGAGAHRPMVLDRGRRHEAPREARERVRETSRRVPPDARELGRGDGRPPHRRPVGHRLEDRAEARRAGDPRRCRSWPRPTRRGWRRRSARRPARGCTSWGWAKAARR